MKTTLKRGIGRSANGNGNGHAVFPPGPISTITRYRQPEPPPRRRMRVLWRILIATLLVLVSLGAAVAGASYLYVHKTVEGLRPTTKDLIETSKVLKQQVAHQPAVALVVGYDTRFGDDPNTARSDTLMLVRADPETKSISLLSFPRDLGVDVYCPGQAPVHDRINSAYARCGTKGTVQTVRKLTGLQPNYVITVDFRGFRRVVDKLGGVWLDIDRRYYNKNDGRESTNFSDIDLQPGYQRLDGARALAFVRFRHTDDDYHRNARQQQFVRALKDQVAENSNDYRKMLQIVGIATESVKVAGKYDERTVLQYLMLAATLPGGHLFQAKIDGLTGYSISTAPEGSVADAVEQFTHPDVGESKAANNAALGRKPKAPKVPAPKDTTVTVLNGSGLEAAAATASGLLAQRGYITMLPPGNALPNAPTQDYFHSTIFFDPAQASSKAAALALKKLVEPADVKPLPKDPALRALDPGATLLFVTGSSFHNALAEAPTVETPKQQPPNVTYDGVTGHDLVDDYRGKVPFKIMVPTVLERSSVPDPAYGDTPKRLYKIEKDHKAIRLVFRTGGNEYWGVEETNWNDAPVLADRSFRHRLKGRDYDFYYSGKHLHMIVLRQGDSTYWVVNTLLDSLSNETMIAIAKGLKPLGPAK